MSEQITITSVSGEPNRPTVAITRPERGRLGELLDDAGVGVVHVPLIETLDPIDPAPLDEALASLFRFEWLVVTSRPGAERVGAAARPISDLKLAAVGPGTAEVLGDLAGRDVDVVPERHTAADLCAAMPDGSSSTPVLIAQADRANHLVATELATKGYSPSVVTAYRTALRSPTAEERGELGFAQAVAFASGSAAIGWHDAFGAHAPPYVIAIGPTTASVCRSLGLQVTHVSADQTVDGLAQTIIDALIPPHHGAIPPDSDHPRPEPPHQ